jgi:threonine aldolase
VILVEQTSNRGGGSIWPVEVLADLVELGRRSGVVLHMDGARLMNAAVAAGVAPAVFARGFDSAWIDLSKGLGCPVGGVLAGTRAFIEEAWIWKHRLGGAMRQSGVLAAAGLYALDHNVARLADDHANARALASRIGKVSGVSVFLQMPATNIVFVDVSGTGLGADEVAAGLRAEGVRMGVEDGSSLRAVTHLDVDRAGVDRAAEVFARIVGRACGER